MRIKHSARHIWGSIQNELSTSCDADFSQGFANVKELCMVVNKNLHGKAVKCASTPDNKQSCKYLGFKYLLPCNYCKYAPLY